MYWLLNLNTMKNTFISTLIAIMITQKNCSLSVFNFVSIPIKKELFNSIDWNEYTEKNLIEN